MIDALKNVSKIVIPEGEALSISKKNGELLWAKLYKEELEYIESPYNGSADKLAYIDTGIYPSETLPFEISFSIPLYPAEYNFGNVFGARAGSGVQEYQMGQYVGGIIGVGTRNYLSFASSNMHHISFDGNKTAVIDGVAHTLNTSAITDQNTIGTIVLFAIRNSGTVIQHEHARIYRCKFGNERDFIPVLDLNDVPCMYDKVTRKLFYNAGVGEFLYAKKQTVNS